MNESSNSMQSMKEIVEFYGGIIEQGAEVEEPESSEALKPPTEEELRAQKHLWEE